MRPPSARRNHADNNSRRPVGVTGAVGLEVLAPELGLRPHLPSVKSTELALAHPAAHDLREAGVIDTAGTVESAVLEWLTVLSRRDVALLMCADTGWQPNRACSAATRCGSPERHRSKGCVSAAPAPPPTEQSAGSLINAHIELLCGQMPSAAMKPVTVEIPELLAEVREGRSRCVSRRPPVRRRSESRC